MATLISEKCWPPSRLTRLALQWASVGLLGMALGVGLWPMPSPHSGEIMGQGTIPLIGSWQKVTNSQCSQMYPDRLEFQESGLYVGDQDAPGTFTHWDAGTYELVSPAQIRISTANDAMVTYSFAIANDVLSFVDPANCEFEYRRIR